MGPARPLREDQTIVIEGGRIQEVGPADQVQVPAGAQRMALPDQTVIPGLVGMHEHLFYPSGGARAAVHRARDELSPAVSGIRRHYRPNSGDARALHGFEPEKDDRPGANARSEDAHYRGLSRRAWQLCAADGGIGRPDDARRFVEYWAGLGAHSFKAYMHITRGELEAALTSAHARGLKITGHLCSVGFREAAALGIDNLEHGLVVDSEFNPGKQPDVCPAGSAQELAQLDINGEAVQRTIHELIQHKVAVTSTLAVFEVAPPLQPRFLDALSQTAALLYLSGRDRLPEQARSMSALRIKKEVEFERAFVKAGGLLMAGCDPTGNGSALAGFGDQRNIELLVEGGFTPAEALQIATFNGAKFLGLDQHIGSIARGKQADLVVLDGNPARQIADIEKVRLVFRDGIGFDSRKLIESVRGQVGLH